MERNKNKIYNKNKQITILLVLNYDTGLLLLACYIMITYTASANLNVMVSAVCIS